MIRSYYCHSLIDNVSLLNGLSCAVVFTEDFIHGGLIESIFTVLIYTVLKLSVNHKNNVSWKFVEYNVLLLQILS